MAVLYNKIPVKMRLSIASALILCFAIAFSGCSKKDTPKKNTIAGPSKIDSTTIVSGPHEGSDSTGADPGDLIANSSFTSVVTIDFGTTVSITNPIPSEVSIMQSGAGVTITASTSGVEYVVTGTTTNGFLKIYSSKKFELNLNGVNITNPNGPAINIQSSKTAFVVLGDGTTNTLTDGGVYAAAPNGEDQKATFFSEGQLIFSGTGSLSVQGNYKHAICSDDYIRIISGNITVTGAASDGMHTNDYFIADGGTVNINASSDAIECEQGYMIFNGGTYTLNSVGKGIWASYDDGGTTVTPYVNINGGTISINSTADNGIDSKSILTINGGNINIKASGNGLIADTAVYVNGGDLYAYSTANDGMDSNGDLTITGGKVVTISTESTGSGIDCGTRQLKITGGMVVGLGATTSSPSATASTVPSLIRAGGIANQLIHIESASGTEALTFLSPVAYSTMLVGGSKLKSNTSYYIYTGGSVAAGVAFNGLYLSGTYTPGVKSTPFTTSSLVTKLGGTVNQ